MAASILRLIRKVREGGEELSTLTELPSQKPPPQPWQGSYGKAAMLSHEPSCEGSAPQPSWTHSGSTSFFVIVPLPTWPSCPCFHVTCHVSDHSDLSTSSSGARTKNMISHVTITCLHPSHTLLATGAIAVWEGERNNVAVQESLHVTVPM